ncbi:lactonase family protein [Rubinisphaera margarita]|uniref:lactonase family protein n=1 Tax=Rubinisphaera margarita TaxID=2909586 RepID=UPI001EE8ADA7|nr:lactonase family protein [Rubinisphaera margarita]MCG6155779.1 lactonase family protein [Rubinisphaera margarita]
MRWFSVGLWLCCVATIGYAQEQTGQQDVTVFVGTYTTAGSQGIYTLNFDPGTGELKHTGDPVFLPNPSFLRMHPKKPVLYAVSEVRDFEGKQTGSVAAYACDSGADTLTLLNQVDSAGGSPCHLAVDSTGSSLVVANYSSGTVASFKIQDDGSLSEAVSVMQHEGSSINETRQEAPHAHSVMISADNRFVYAADLGTDKVMIYRFDPKSAELTPASSPPVDLEPGSGPRHLVINTEGDGVYVLNELASTITLLERNGETGSLAVLQTMNTLPEGFEGTNGTAEILLHPSGKSIYASNRGHDSIAMFKVVGCTGRLESQGHISTGGEVPRNFNIVPGGNWLLAANQKTNNIVVFRIDPEFGQLENSGQSISVPAPVCLCFTER